MWVALDVITQGHGEVLAHAATKGHVWVHGPAAVWACYNQKPDKHLWAGLAPGAMLLSGCYVELAPPLTWAVWENCQEGVLAGEGSPVPHQLQHLGEWALHLSQEAQ